MANSKTINSGTIYGSRSFKLECTQVSNGSFQNSSTITWKLSAIGDSTQYSTGPTTVIINGTTVYSKGRTDWSAGTFPVAQGSTSGTIVVNHNNDGTKSINVSFSTAVYNSTVHTYSDTWTLDSIPRYTTITKFNVYKRDETSVMFDWMASDSCDWAWYSTDGGFNWVNLPSNNIISGLSANTEYNFKLRVRRTDSQLITDSGPVKQSTYDYPYCTNSPNFILGDELTLTFYNPLSRAFKFYIIGNGTQINVEYSCSSTTYKGINDTTSVSYLYATIPNAKSGKYKVKVVYSSSAKTRDNNNTYSIKESVCYPTFSNFGYRDTNASVTAVTGNNQVLVKGLSTLTLDISSANQMVAVNSAIAKNYVANIDTLSKTINYSASDVSQEVGVVNTAGTIRLNVTAYDSRNMPKSAYKDIMICDYGVPVINVSAKRLNDFETQTTLSVNGSFSTLNIGGVDKNTLTSVQYRYREVGGAWGSYANLTTTITNGSFTCADVVLSLDNTKAFEFEIKVIDNLSSHTESASVNVGMAIFFVSSNKKTAYLNMKEVATYKDMFPVGSVYCNSTNTDPASIYGGTWILIDKGFTSYTGNDMTIFTADTDVELNTAYITRSGGTIRIRLQLRVNTAMTDTGMTLGSFNWDKVGITGLPMSFFDMPTYSYGANGGIVYNISYGGEVEQTNVFDLTSIPSGSTFTIDVTFTLSQSYMLNAMCDKFYWKRTA